METLATFSVDARLYEELFNRLPSYFSALSSFVPAQDGRMQVFRLSDLDDVFFVIRDTATRLSQELFNNQGVVQYLTG